MIRRAIDFLIGKHELIATVLMTTSATVTAWCAFEATIWSGEQSKSFARAAGARTESTRNELIDHQLVSIDVATFLAWLEAVDTGESSRRSTFLHERLRPDFRPAFDAWLAFRPFENHDAPPTPFLMDEYRRPRADRADALLQDAERDVEAGLADNLRSDRYMLVTVLSSLVIFCAGLSSKLTLPKNGLILLLTALTAFLVCLVALFRLPITFF